jgi:hypothetical protein
VPPKYPGDQSYRTLELRIQALERRLEQLKGGFQEGDRRLQIHLESFMTESLREAEPRLGSISHTQLADSIIPVIIVDELPVLPDPYIDYVVGKSHVLLTTDNKLYKCVSITGVPANDWQYIVDATLIDGLIDGAQIKEDTIAAKNIIVTDWENRITDPFFADSTAWTTRGAVTFIALVAGDPAKTGAKLDGDGTNASGLWQAAVAMGEGEVIACILYAKAYGAPPNLTVLVESFDGGGASLGVQTALTFASTDTAWAQRSGEVTTPTGTATIQVRYEHAAAVAAGSGYRITRAVVRKSAAGNLIVDGEISARHLAVDAVVAGTIAAGAINTREISAGAVTTDRLTAGDIQVTNANRQSAALSFLTAGGVEVLRLGNISGKSVGADYGLWGVLGSGVFIEGAPKILTVFSGGFVVYTTTDLANGDFVHLSSSQEANIAASFSIAAGRSVVAMGVLGDFQAYDRAAGAGFTYSYAVPARCFVKGEMLIGGSWVSTSQDGPVTVSDIRIRYGGTVQANGNTVGDPAINVFGWVILLEVDSGTFLGV